MFRSCVMGLFGACLDSKSSAPTRAAFFHQGLVWIGHPLVTAAFVLCIRIQTEKELKSCLYPIGRFSVTSQKIDGLTSTCKEDFPGKSGSCRRLAARFRGVDHRFLWSGAPPGSAAQQPSVGLRGWQTTQTDRLPHGTVAIRPL